MSWVIWVGFLFGFGRLGVFGVPVLPFLWAFSGRFWSLYGLFLWALCLCFFWSLPSAVCCLVWFVARLFVCWFHPCLFSCCCIFLSNWVLFKLVFRGLAFLCFFLLFFSLCLFVVRFFVCLLLVFAVFLSLLVSSFVLFFFYCWPSVCRCSLSPLLLCSV